ncbi:16S rRNA (guanine(966)-N(2))-methyltransferase RsmD [Buchnera aphidicola (Rhopalosiphum padi)]|uniref:Ribosomal RNA small subunit methyltransferase D n=1 Tax=Buchnera aphidicola subsp. Rhopalosiphum padi TaxID=98793 RepID=A0A4D6Y5I0_BUCRP|nr:16S rRNA (guanine(966)-N(2))-methyltransferase RsmD [Buchnera aphidicola]QCI24687.1 16S rRNA (guanine(966)-N(2))-methyltransferase RsmD [Buchnera aphidicola (Rhopalosiphum padi)]
MHNAFLKKNGKVHIIAGKLKGKKIFIKNNLNIRPTTNRIRETLFNWLSVYIKNARCLDCFAGSGSLGIEAVSRDAKFVTLLEIEKKTVLSLKDNIKRLNISNLEIIHTNTLDWLKKNKQPYDIIFIDPPYNQKLVDQTLFLLEKKKWMKKKSLIYIEKEKNHSFVISKNWTLYKKKTTNRISCYLYFFNM